MSIKLTILASLLTGCTFITNITLDDAGSINVSDAAVETSPETSTKDASVDTVDESIAHLPCLDRSGTYTEHFTVRSGSCGLIGDQAVVITTDQLQGWIAQETDVEDQNCTVLYEERYNGVSYWLQENGSINWSQDANSGVGQLYLMIGNTTTTNCMGLYDVSFSR